MAEIDDRPGHAGGAIGEGENDEPGEEENQYIGSPNAGIGEPLSVLVQIRRRRHLDVEFSHQRRSRLDPNSIAIRPGEAEGKVRGNGVVVGDEESLGVIEMKWWSSVACPTKGAVVEDL